ncbi:MAG TPA: DNA-processing protein DprA, partial [Solirubrobacteraceae bacterium]|nr:DNA-processing protein DprA [Solirubrobacteraceae bacterium]
MAACDACLRRTALLALVAPWLEHANRERRLRGGLLALGDEELVAAVGGARRSELEARAGRLSVDRLRRRIEAAGLHAVCRHDAGYPARLLAAPDAPAALLVAGDAAHLSALAGEHEPAVAIVGSRRATAYGVEVARSLGRGLAAARVTVVSGMALGVDSAAHAGALEVGGPTIAVLAGGADVPYPATKAPLRRRIVAGGGCVVSEMPPGFRAFRWGFPARNRIIAGLAQSTIVVEAAERSGSLITAEIAEQLGRIVAAVPGPVTSPASAGANALLRDGAELVRDAQDVLDTLLGPGVASVRRGPDPAALEPRLRAVLERLGEAPAGPAALLGPGD